MILKIAGQKNELTQQERKEWQQIIGNSYKIFKQTGLTGFKTSAYLIENKNKEKFALKISNNDEDINWKIHHEKEEGKRTKYSINYQGSLNIPKTITSGDNYTIEEYAGLDFTDEIYATLSKKEKEKIVESLATFLIHLHKQNNDEYTKEPFYQIITFDKIYNYIEPALNNEQRTYISNMLKEYGSDNEEKLMCKTHHDIRSQNLLYNENSKVLSLIDFDCAKKDNIYFDFVPIAVASFGLPYNFWFKVIDKYNELAEKKLKVKKSKIKLLHEIGIIHEIGKYALKDKTKDEALNELIKLAFQKIKTLNKEYDKSNKIKKKAEGDVIYVCINKQKSM